MRFDLPRETIVEIMAVCGVANGIRLDGANAKNGIRSTMAALISRIGTTISFS